MSRYPPEAPLPTLRARLMAALPMGPTHIPYPGIGGPIMDIGRAIIRPKWIQMSGNRKFARSMPRGNGWPAIGREPLSFSQSSTGKIKRSIRSWLYYLIGIHLSIRSANFPATWPIRLRIGIQQDATHPLPGRLYKSRSGLTLQLQAGILPGRLSIWIDRFGLRTSSCVPQLGFYYGHKLQLTYRTTAIQHPAHQGHK